VRRLRRAILAGVLGATSAGCAAPAPHVAQGEAFTTGNPTFDDFFTAVREVRAEALAAPKDEEAAHAGLIKALGLEPTALTAMALDETGLRAKKLKDKGILLHLEISPDTKLIAVRGKADLGPDGEALLRAMEDAARTSLEMQKRLAAVAARAVELEKRRVDLRGEAPAAFRDDKQAKRDEIITELDAAKGVLADAGTGASQAAGAAARFVVELVQAAETGGGAMLDPGRLARAKKVPGVVGAPAALPVKTASGPAPAAGGGRAAPAPKTAAPAAPAPPPQKKPKGGDDFEP
jgi:hypothetical protein